MSNDDLKDCWQDLGVGGLIVPPAKPYDIDQALEKAALKAAAEMTAAGLTPSLITPEALQEIVLKGSKLFVKHWLGMLRQEDLGGLIGFMVDGLRLQAVELGQFVRAIPLSVLDKFVQSRVGSARGTHALLALEWHRRQNGTDFAVFDQEGAVMVRVVTANEDVIFGLDETFES